jgi:hypothetical protein
MLIITRPMMRKKILAEILKNARFNKMMDPTVETASNFLGKKSKKAI